MKYIKPLPDYDFLHEILRYDPDTGKLYWKVNRGKNCLIGKEAGGPKNGYIRLRIDNDHFWAHRIIWKMMTGNDPISILDHINQIKTDNRFENLREITNSGNGQNVSCYKHNTSGFKGVHFHSKNKKWTAYIKKDQKLIHGGCFENIEDAIKRRKELEEEYHEFAT